MVLWSYGTQAGDSVLLKEILNTHKAVDESVILFLATFQLPYNKSCSSGDTTVTLCLSFSRKLHCIAFRHHTENELTAHVSWELWQKLLVFNLYLLYLLLRMDALISKAVLHTHSCPVLPQSFVLAPAQLHLSSGGTEMPCSRIRPVVEKRKGAHYQPLEKQRLKKWSYINSTVLLQ